MEEEIFHHPEASSWRLSSLCLPPVSSSPSEWQSVWKSLERGQPNSNKLTVTLGFSPSPPGSQKSGAGRGWLRPWGLGSGILTCFPGAAPAGEKLTGKGPLGPSLWAGPHQHWDLPERGPQSATRTPPGRASTTHLQTVSLACRPDTARPVIFRPGPVAPGNTGRTEP